MGAAFRGFAETQAGEFVTCVGAIEGHELWAPYYDSQLNVLRELERRAMRRRLQRICANQVVDVACGTGVALLEWQRRGARVIGIDACEAMLEEASKHTSLRGLVTRGRAEALPLPSGFADAVLCSLALGYFDDLDASLEEFQRVAKPGAVIAISDIHPAAIANGWKRSFQAGGIRYELANHRRPLEVIKQSAKAAGLEAECIEVLSFGEEDRALFRQAGREDLFERVAGMSALFLGTWRKPC